MSGFRRAVALGLALPFLIAANSAPQPLPVADNIPAARDVAYPGTIQLSVEATDLARGILKVRETIPVAGPGPLVLLAPKWIPGNHAPRGPIEKLANLEIYANGQKLPWLRDPVDVYAFHVNVPAGVTEIEARFVHLAATASDQGRITVTREMMNVQWEAVSLYPAGYFTRQIPIQASLTIPAGWRAATALRPTGSDGGRIDYAPVSYEVLQDSPVFAGKYFRADDLGHGVTLNTVADEAKELEIPADILAKHRALVDQALKLFGSRHFDHYDFLHAVTDRMGGIGLEHHRSSENQNSPGYFTDWKKSLADHNLLPHEFTHSWNGKFRRGADLWTPDFRTPMRDSLLWVYEGQTQFWGYVLEARSGLSTEQEVLDKLALIAAGLDNAAGRQWRPLIDTTNDPIISARRPKGWTSLQRSEDYYNEGLLIWTEADAIIRQGTKGKRGMDDFARAFFGINDGDWGEVTYTFDDVVKTLGDVYPHDWAAFLRKRVYEVSERAPLEGFTRSGYRLIYTDTPTEAAKAIFRSRESADFSYSLGISVGKEARITSVLWGSPAFNAGLTVGQSIVSVNGHAYSEDALTEAVKAAKGRTAAIRLIVSGARKSVRSTSAGMAACATRASKRSAKARGRWTSCFSRAEIIRLALGAPRSKGSAIMRIDLIPSGDDVPHSINVLIEVPIGGEPVKYEFDKPSGAIFVDRILHTPMRYPCNYGFIPQTLCGDGDPLDVLVMTRWTLFPGTVIAARPVGVLYLEDEAGTDEKILAVPTTKISPYYKDVENYTDLPPIVVEQIEHFFTHYKDLEAEKWVRVGKWGDAEAARKAVLDSIEMAKGEKAPA